MRFRMRVKIQLRLYLCLSMMFVACVMEPFSSSSPTLSDQTTRITIASFTENEKDSGSGTELNTSPEEMNTESILTPPGLTVPAKMTNETANIANNDGDHDAAFVYDYSSLRHVGLFVAAVLFLMGIAVMTFGRVCRKSRCHVTSGKFYEVNRV
ncbi:FXYD domain containing ion transport regulator 5 [Paramormyrops kingsleyae]|uniref:FXYD domain containing ion transport regulator 5 n=1 Tax=Paramormyrops kingsleyae TaxID=1676925 RepID=UPI003B96DCA5